MHGGHHEQHHHHHVPRKPIPQAPVPHKPRRLGLAPVDRTTFLVVIVPIAVIIWAIGIVHNWG